MRGRADERACHRPAPRELALRERASECYLPPLLSDFFTGPVVLARTTIRKTGLPSGWQAKRVRLWLAGSFAGFSTNAGYSASGTIVVSSTLNVVALPLPTET